MAESKNPLASFPEYFSIRLAVTPPYRQETYRIRYRVYCEEFGYEPAERFPNHMETDGFDGISTHCLITHLASGMAAGCVRMCPASINGVDQPLPYDQCCADGLDPVAMAGVTAPRDMRCEASRFAVDGAFRRRSGETLTRFGEIASLDLSGPGAAYLSADLRGADARRDGAWPNAWGGPICSPSWNPSCRDS